MGSTADRGKALAWLEEQGLACARPRIRQIDAGVRDIVQALWDVGVHTVDSGDGRSKPSAGRTMDAEHVVAEPLLESTSATAWRVQEVLAFLRAGEAWRVEVITAHELPRRRQPPRDLVVATRMDPP